MARLLLVLGVRFRGGWKAEVHAVQPERNKTLSTEDTQMQNTNTVKKRYLRLGEASFDRGVRGSNLKEDKPDGAWKTKPRGAKDGPGGGSPAGTEAG